MTRRRGKIQQPDDLLLSCLQSRNCAAAAAAAAAAEDGEDGEDGSSFVLAHKTPRSGSTVSTEQCSGSGASWDPPSGPARGSNTSGTSWLLVSELLYYVLYIHDDVQIYVIHV